MIKGKRIFITVGCGFIGSTLVATLIEDNEIVVFDNMRRDVLRNKKARDLIDFDAEVDLEEGLWRTADYYCDMPADSRDA